MTEVEKKYKTNYTNNKSYIDNIDAYNRDRALITKSFSDRLGLGQFVINVSHHW